MFKSLLYVVACVFVLTGCAGSPADLSIKAKKAKSSFVGTPASSIISCAGVPTEVAKISGIEYLSYRSEEGCIATLTVQNGVVSQVNYSGYRGALLQPWQSCGAIFYGCFAQ